MNFIQRYQPALSWASELDRLFDRSFIHPAFTAAPREAFHESETAWILRLDLPGFAKEDIKLTVTDGTLQLAAETPADRPFGGKLERQWKLGDDVDGAATTARLENGVLELTLPKKPKVVVQPANIQIN
ncbi:MAG: Hsp20/alpha crystallin family protein [Verrucomicrobiota bacterium]